MVIIIISFATTVIYAEVLVNADRYGKYVNAAFLQGFAF